jgi:hypothetical protein
VALSRLITLATPSLALQTRAGFRRRDGWQKRVP